MNYLKNKVFKVKKWKEWERKFKIIFFIDNV